MPPFFPNDFVSPSKAIALVGAALYGNEWNGCPTRGESVSLHNAVAAFRKARTIARQRELWPALSASSRIMRRRARVLELSDEGAAKQFVSLGDADKKAIADEIDAKFAEDLARERHCRNAKTRLLELFCSAQVITTLLASNGKTYEMPCEFWASDQAGSAVDSEEASYNPAIYNSEPFGMLQGRVLVPKADLKSALEEAPDSGAARSDAMDVDTLRSDQTDAEIDIMQGDTREAEPDSSDDAGNQKSESAKSRRGNPKWIRGPYYEPLRNCLRSKAKMLKKNEESLCHWFEGLSRSEFCKSVKPALDGIDLPSDRTLYDNGRKIVAEIEKR
jgi:hypothetical protein